MEAFVFTVVSLGDFYTRGLSPCVNFTKKLSSFPISLLSIVVGVEAADVEAEGGTGEAGLGISGMFPDSFIYLYQLRCHQFVGEAGLDDEVTAGGALTKGESLSE